MSLRTLVRRRRVILAIVGGWIAMGAIGVGYEPFQARQRRNLLGQPIPPISFENTPASVAIERMLRLAKDPIDVRICRNLSNKTVTLQTNQPVTSALYAGLPLLVLLSPPARRVCI